MVPYPRGGYLEGYFNETGRYEWDDTPWKRVASTTGPDRASELGPMGVEVRHPARSWTGGLRREPKDPPQAITGKLASRRTVNAFRKGTQQSKVRGRLAPCAHEWEALRCSDHRCRPRSGAGLPRPSGATPDEPRRRLQLCPGRSPTPTPT